METVEFIEDGHLYLVDGCLTPSVSQIIRFIFPKKYSDVPPHILKRACEFGTNVHHAIEMHENLEPFILTDEERRCFYDYLELKQKHNILPLFQEELLNYKDEYCGRLDMIGAVGGKLSLIDIKTTSKLDYESLSWQLGMYALAYEYLKGSTFEAYYCLWLPKKEKGQLVEIKPKSKEEILEVLRKYKEAN